MAPTILFLRYSNVFLCVYPRLFNIGTCENGIINENNCFTFDLCHLSKLYSTLVEILTLMKESALNEEKVQKFCEFENRCYFWRMKDSNSVIWSNQNGDNEILRLTFSYLQLNEVIFSIYESIVPMLCLKNFDAQFIDSLVDMDPVELHRLTKASNFYDFLRESKFENESYRLFHLFKFYLDVIFIFAKLKKFCNHELLPNNIKPLL